MSEQRQPKSIELNEQELESVTGGWGGSDWRYRRYRDDRDDCDRYYGRRCY